MPATALLVIDLQVGAFDGKVIPAIHSGDALLDRAARLIEAARAANAPVIFVQHCAPQGQLLTEGTERWQLHPRIEPEPDEVIVRKRESSAFTGTDLLERLEERRVDGVIACGLQSEHCVSNTALSALELGLNVYVAGDAHSTWSTDDEDASAIIERQNRLSAVKGATVEPTSSLEKLLTG